MHARLPYRFKIASEEWELEQVHRLNYATFVEEIPQHPSNDLGVLVDRFDLENTYIICLRENQLIGMVAARSNRPFSLDQKLENLDTYLPPGQSICEIRLLAVDRRYRHSSILCGLVASLAEYGNQHGYNLAIVSAYLKQLRLYRHLGFVPFGPLVGTGEAQFQPMYLTRQAFEARARGFLRPFEMRNQPESRDSSDPCSRTKAQHQAPCLFV